MLGFNSPRLKYLLLLVLIQKYAANSQKLSSEEKKELRKEEQRLIQINLADITINQAKQKLSQIKVDFQEKMELPENKNFDLHDLLETSQDLDTFMAAHQYQFVDSINTMIKNAEQVRDMLSIDANKKTKSRGIDTLKRFLAGLQGNYLSTRAMKKQELIKNDSNAQCEKND